MSYAGMFNGAEQLVPGALRGYRTWTVLPVGLLASTGVSHVWGAPPDVRPDDWSWRLQRLGGALPEGPLAQNVERATCLRDSVPCPCPACSPAGVTAGHEAPDPSCRCGIYGWYDPADTRIVRAPVFGAIEATGRTIVGTHGFRTSRARVLAIAATGDRAIDRRLSARGYKVLPLRDDVLELYPPDDVRGLVDHACDGHCALVTAMGGRPTYMVVPIAVSVDQARRAFEEARAAFAKVAMQASSSVVAFATDEVATWRQANPALGSPEESPRERALRLKQERNAGPRPWLPSSLWRRAVGQ